MTDAASCTSPASRSGRSTRQSKRSISARLRPTWCFSRFPTAISTRWRAPTRPPRTRGRRSGSPRLRRSVTRSRSTSTSSAYARAPGWWSRACSAARTIGATASTNWRRWRAGATSSWRCCRETGAGMRASMRPPHSGAMRFSGSGAISTKADLITWRRASPFSPPRSAPPRTLRRPLRSTPSADLSAPASRPSRGRRTRLSSSIAPYIWPTTSRRSKPWPRRSATRAWRPRASL